jgi:hypothetical protein
MCRAFVLSELHRFLFVGPFRLGIAKNGGWPEGLGRKAETVLVLSRWDAPDAVLI